MSDADARMDTATIRRLAVEAECDPRSLLREVNEPGSVRGLPGHRIRAVLAKHKAGT